MRIGHLTRDTTFGAHSLRGASYAAVNEQMWSTNERRPKRQGAPAACVRVVPEESAEGAGTPILCALAAAAKGLEQPPQTPPPQRGPIRARFLGGGGSGSPGPLPTALGAKLDCVGRGSDSRGR